MSDTQISFIGAGNMARSIIGGLVEQGFAPQNIIASDPNPEQRQALADDFGIRVTDDNAQACQNAQLLVLAVKPQVMAEVCRPLRASLAHQPVVLSIAAGVTCAHLQAWLGESLPIVRCMPNTPSLVRQGAAGLFAAPAVSEPQRALAEQIMAAVGVVQWVEQENLIDAITALSGSGPAYFFYFMEAMVNAAVELGLDPETARTLAIQTAKGAARLAEHSDTDLAELRRRVTSPGGTTEQAIRMFEQRDLPATVRAAMDACAQRSVELAQNQDRS